MIKIKIYIFLLEIFIKSLLLRFIDKFNFFRNLESKKCFRKINSKLLKYEKDFQIYLPIFLFKHNRNKYKKINRGLENFFLKNIGSNKKIIYLNCDDGYFSYFFSAMGNKVYSFSDANNKIDILCMINESYKIKNSLFIKDNFFNTPLPEAEIIVFKINHNDLIEINSNSFLKRRLLNLLENTISKKLFIIYEYQNDLKKKSINELNKLLKNLVFSELDKMFLKKGINEMAFKFLMKAN